MKKIDIFDRKNVLANFLMVLLLIFLFFFSKIFQENVMVINFYFIVNLVIYQLNISMGPNRHDFFYEKIIKNPSLNLFRILRENKNQ